MRLLLARKNAANPPRPIAPHSFRSAFQVPERPLSLRRDMFLTMNRNVPIAFIATQIDSGAASALRPGIED
jgi:hypothetical protein